MVRAILDDVPGKGWLNGSGDVEDAGLRATGTETAPVGLGQRFLGGAAWQERFAEASQDLFVFVLGPPLLPL